jgi:hypothetical protein
MTNDFLDEAVKNLGVKNRFQVGERQIILACLLREDDWRPLLAEWWKGKQVSIIAADIDGNFFLSHSDGSVRYWNHQTKTDEVVSSSVKSFISNIGWDNL